MPKIHLNKREPLEPITIEPYPIACFKMEFESGSLIVVFQVSDILFGKYFWDVDTNELYLQDW